MKRPADVPVDNQDEIDENVVTMEDCDETEEKRRKDDYEMLKKQELVRIQSESDALAKEAERSELDVDELTTLRQLEAKLGLNKGQSQGPMIPSAGIDVITFDLNK